MTSGTQRKPSRLASISSMCFICKPKLQAEMRCTRVCISWICDLGLKALPLCEKQSGFQTLEAEQKHVPCLSETSQVQLHICYIRLNLG